MPVILISQIHAASMFSESSVLSLDQLCCVVTEVECFKYFILKKAQRTPLSTLIPFGHRKLYINIRCQHARFFEHSFANITDSHI